MLMFSIDEKEKCLCLMSAGYSLWMRAIIEKNCAVVVLLSGMSSVFYYRACAVVIGMLYCMNASGNI